MKIDLKKIINIKKKKDLTQFKLNKPIFYNNYLYLMTSMSSGASSFIFS